MKKITHKSKITVYLTVRWGIHDISINAETYEDRSCSLDLIAPITAQSRQPSRHLPGS